jgi:hypothetical protein
MAENVRRPGREILDHAPTMPPALAAVAGRGGVQAGAASNNRAAAEACSPAGLHRA